MSEPFGELGDDLHALMLTGVGCGYWAYVRLIERRFATELAPRVRTIILTALLGLAILLIPVTLLYMTGTYRIVGSGESSGMAGVALIILAAAILLVLVIRRGLIRSAERNHVVRQAVSHEK